MSGPGSWLVRLRWSWRTRGLGRASQERCPLDCLEAARFAEARAAYRGRVRKDAAATRRTGGAG